MNHVKSLIFTMAFQKNLNRLYHKTTSGISAILASNATVDSQTSIGNIIIVMGHNKSNWPFIFQDQRQSKTLICCCSDYINGSAIVFRLISVFVLFLYTQTNTHTHTHTYIYIYIYIYICHLGFVVSFIINITSFKQFVNINIVFITSKQNFVIVSLKVIDMSTGIQGVFDVIESRLTYSSTFRSRLQFIV